MCFACWCRPDRMGLRPEPIAERLSLAPNTLSFHFDRLRQAGLVTVQARRPFADLCHALRNDERSARLPHGELLRRRRQRLRARRLPPEIVGARKEIEGARMTTDRIYNVLFLCTGNSARSMLAEAILNKIGAGKFSAYSAGTQPKGQVHPHTLQLLRSAGYDVSGFRSKSWSEFARPGAPALDFVFTVCDDAAGESLSALAGPADDRALGHSRSGGGDRNADGGRARVQRRLPDAASADRRRSPRCRSARSTSSRCRHAPRDRADGRRDRQGNDVTGMLRSPRGSRNSSAARCCSPPWSVPGSWREARRRQRRARAARQHAADRRHPGGADPDLRPGLGRAFQSGGDARVRQPRRARDAGRARSISPRRSPARLPAPGWRT